jgi:hypothetical protein
MEAERGAGAYAEMEARMENEEGGDDDVSGDEEVTAEARVEDTARVGAQDEGEVEEPKIQQTAKERTTSSQREVE